MKRYFLILLIFIELSIIVFLVCIIYLKKENNYKVSIAPIKESYIVNTPIDNLKFFSEPLPSQTIVDEIDWLPITPRPKHIINDDSLNEIVNYKILKPTAVFRIIALGDSFTYGLYVNTKEAWVKLLEKNLNINLNCKNIKKIEVINLGVPGYDIEYSVKRFSLRGQKYDPDLILWFLKDDDFNIVNEYFIPKQQKLVKELNINTYSKDYYFKDGEPYPLFPKIIEEIKKEIGEKKYLDYQINALKKINNLFKKKLLIFTFPFTNNQYQNIIKNFVETRKQSYFFNNLTDIYKIGGLSFPDGHPNQKGHELIAKDLYNYLVKNKIIPCD